MIALLRVLPALLLSAVAGWGAWTYQQSKVDRLMAENAAQDIQIASQSRSLQVFKDRDRQRRAADAYLRTLEQHVAAREAALRAQLRRYIEGETCDPTDPGCAVDFINDLLRGTGSESSD